MTTSKTTNSNGADPVPISELETRNLNPETCPHTQAGTPASSLWTPEWLAAVDAAETRLGHRICGARTIAGTPCELASTHESGRCRFHGGFSLTGAPKGNRNAILHGLYSRRLRTCGSGCPQWDSCPCAGPDIAALPPNQRPTCPYEQTEYNAALTDALALIDLNPDHNPFMRHLAHDLALLQVMLGRTAAPLANTAPPAETDAAPSKSAASPWSPHMRIAAEIRRLYKVISASAESDGFLAVNREHKYYNRSILDADTTLEANTQREPEPEPPLSDDERIRRHVDQALYHVTYSHRTGLGHWRDACCINADAASEYADQLIDAWKPQYDGYTKEAFEQYVITYIT